MYKNNPPARELRASFELKYNFISTEAVHKILMHPFEALYHLVTKLLVQYQVDFILAHHFSLIQFENLFKLPTHLKFNDILSVPLIKTNFVRRVWNIAEISHKRLIN